VQLKFKDLQQLNEMQINNLLSSAQHQLIKFLCPTRHKKYVISETFFPAKLLAYGIEETKPNTTKANNTRTK